MKQFDDISPFTIRKSHGHPLILFKQSAKTKKETQNRKKKKTSLQRIGFKHPKSANLALSVRLRACSDSARLWGGLDDVFF